MNTTQTAKLSPVDRIDVDHSNATLTRVPVTEIRPGDKVVSVIHVFRVANHIIESGPEAGERVGYQAAGWNAAHLDEGVVTVETIDSNPAAGISARFHGHGRMIGVGGLRPVYRIDFN